MPYKITIIDLFHRGDPEAHWSGGIYETTAEAIASVKSSIDHDLKSFLIDEAREGELTAEGLVDRYRLLGEMPVAFGPDYKPIFSSDTYVAARAAELVAEARRAPVEKPASVVPPVSPAAATAAARDRTFRRPAVRDVLPAIVLILGMILLVVLSPRR